MNVATPFVNDGVSESEGEITKLQRHVAPSKAVAPQRGSKNSLRSFIGQGKNFMKSIHFEVEDGTETTAGETEYSSDQSSAVLSPLRTPVSVKAPLHVLPHAVHETNDHDISIPSLTQHRVLGEGFFGQVWLVSNPENEQVYALKRLSKFDVLCEDQVESVINEKLVMMHLHHPFIVQLRASFQDESYLYLLQDFYQGGELFSLLHNTNSSANNNSKHNPFLPEDSCRFYIACIADALWYMHCQDIVYRDLKPENVMLNHKGYPVLIDLGYAKLLPPDQKSYTLCGTPKYLAPEMVEGMGHSHAVDYWALGIVLYELASGEHPFEFWADMDELTLYGSIAEAEYLELPEECQLSAAGRQVLDQLLIKTPTARLGALNESPTHNGVLAHAWIARSRLDMHHIRRQSVPAPWIPRVTSALDDCHFDAVDDDEHDDLDDDDALNMGDIAPCLSAKEQARFADFDGY